MTKQRSRHLFSPGEARDKTFVFNRDCKSRAEFRTEVERMWALYRPYCPDTHFEIEFRNDFLARLWEIHLANALLDNGFTLEKPPAHGPDILITSPKVWMEAVTATVGKGVNEVIDLPPGQAGHFPEHEIILRFTSALASKQRRVADYVKKGIIETTDPVVVAINSAEIGPSYVEFDPDVPMIVKTVFPLSDLVFHLPVMGSPGKPFSRYKIDPTRKNANGAEVRTDTFLSSDYACMSAVLFCPTSVLNSKRPYGRNFLLIHNPNATVPLPLGTFPFGREFWASKNETGDLALQKPKDWRNPMPDEFAE